MNKNTFLYNKLEFLKDWPLWLLIWEVFAILCAVGHTRWGLNVILLLLSVFLFSCLGVFLLSKYPQCDKLIAKYIAAIMVFLFFYSPYWSASMFMEGSSSIYGQEYSILGGVLLFILFVGVGKIFNKKVSELWLWIFFIIVMGVSVTFDNVYMDYPLTRDNYLSGMLISFIFFQFFFQHLILHLTGNVLCFPGI